MEEFPRIQRLPPYVFNVTGELKLTARRHGEDVIDFSMGNPDGPTPAHIVEKLIETVRRPDTHGLDELLDDVRRRRAVGIAHAEVDDVLAVTPRGKLQLA